MVTYCQEEYNERRNPEEVIVVLFANTTKDCVSKERFGVSTSCESDVLKNGEHHCEYPHRNVHATVLLKAENVCLERTEQTAKRQEEKNESRDDSQGNLSWSVRVFFVNNTNADPIGYRQ